MSVTDDSKDNFSDLEKAVLGIPFSGDLKFFFSGKSSISVERMVQIPSPVYLVQVDQIDELNCGFFKLPEGNVAVPLGVSRKKHFFFKEFYQFDETGNLVYSSKNSDVLYLPLELTQFKAKIRQNNRRPKFSPVYGIRGTNGLHPVLFASETEKGIQYVAPFRNGSDVSTYTPKSSQPNDENVRNLLSKYFSPQASADPRSLPEPKSFPSVIIGKPKTDFEVVWEEPRSIVNYLDLNVIGQETAKKVVAVAFSNYMVKVRKNSDDLQKENILLIGPSGSGKTYMVSLLAKKASLPMVDTKLTGKSSEGYKGENLSGAFEVMRAKTQGDAPYGVMFFDEIDKLVRDTNGSGGHFFGSRIQDEMIGWLEEATIVGRETHNGKETKNPLNTRNLLFVTAGAFQGSDSDYSLSTIIDRRLKSKTGSGKKTIGFLQNDVPAADPYNLGRVRPEDLIEYGLKPELIGRLPAIGILMPLTIDDKVKILSSTSKSPLSNYALLLKEKGYTLEVEPGVLTMIAEQCPPETGARALSSLCNALFTEVLFDPSFFADARKVVRVTPEITKERLTLYA